MVIIDGVEYITELDKYLQAEEEFKLRLSTDHAFAFAHCQQMNQKRLMLNAFTELVLRKKQEATQEAISHSLEALGSLARRMSYFAVFVVRTGYFQKILHIQSFKSGSPSEFSYIS